jgi:hypothetical protein
MPAVLGFPWSRGVACVHARRHLLVVPGVKPHLIQALTRTVEDYKFRCLSVCVTTGSLERFTTE